MFILIPLSLFQADHPLHVWGALLSPSTHKYMWLPWHLKYDDMSVWVHVMYYALCVTNCLRLCQLCMHCCLGLWRGCSFQSGLLWPWLCKWVCNVITSGGEELLRQGTINCLIDACHANMTCFTHHISWCHAHAHMWMSGACECKRGHQHVNKSDPNTLMYTLYVFTCCFTPCVENDRLLRGCDPLPMLFVFRVTYCPLSWPLTLEPSPSASRHQHWSDSSQSLLTPNCRRKKRERNTKIWPLTFFGKWGGSVYPAEWQFTCSMRSRRIKCGSHSWKMKSKDRRIGIQKERDVKNERKKGGGGGGKGW